MSNLLNLCLVFLTLTLTYSLDSERNEECIDLTIIYSFLFFFFYCHFIE